MVGRQSVSKDQVVKSLRGFDKESHANSLAASIMKQVKDGADPDGAIKKANAVVKALREAKVTSFYAAEYAKVFDDPEAALSTRERLIAEYELEHGLTTRRAAKMADCVVFSTAKNPSQENLERVAKRAHIALSTGVPFGVAADVVYYNNPQAEPALFARRCVETSIKQNKPMDVSETDLASMLASETPVDTSQSKQTAQKELRDVLDGLKDFQ